ncbi:hypothetical protein ACFQFQ_24175 [Sulfitobacter porphyrae]|uniref:TonB-dependent receptor-like beta-barrel domain-containing protein n=1 Tax=Sulfitobacter porphyrae TaxID=1246864 RepID=A0ABW2BAV4_9RHOB
MTKRPVFDRLAEGRLSYGSNNTAEAGFDWSDTISADGTMAARVTGLLRNGETEIDGSDNDRAFLAGGFTWAPSDNTTLTLLGHVQQDARTPLIFSPIAGDDFDPAFGSLPADFAYRQSDYNHFETTQESLGWELSHQFGEGFLFNQRVRFAHQTTDYAHLDYSYADAAGLHYYAFRNDEDARTFGIDNNVKWDSQLFGADNSLIAASTINTAAPMSHNSTTAPSIPCPTAIRSLTFPWPIRRCRRATAVFTKKPASTFRTT